MRILKINRQKSAFTIIEVVLILAIAGLIFLMVFIALPALQRNQRDTARRNDIATIAAAVRNWQSNNRNKKLPIINGYTDDIGYDDKKAYSHGVGTVGETTNGIMSYIKETSRIKNVWVAWAGITTAGSYDRLDFVRIWVGAECSGEEKTFMGYYPLALVSNNNSKIAITTMLENSNQQYCLDV